MQFRLEFKNNIYNIQLVNSLKNQMFFLKFKKKDQVQTSFYVKQ